MRRLLASDVIDRGLRDISQLDPDERYVYLVSDLEVLMDMEGWDDFFINRPNEHYWELKEYLKAAGDTDSLTVLQDYENSFREHGVPFTPESIDAFLLGCPDEFFDQEPDWRQRFDYAREARWTLVQEYLAGRGIELDVTS